MRFVKLKRKKGKSPYDSILKFGCGPNFVLNRSELFQQMVKEQGVTFWFRFWLTFCLHPGCSDLKAIQQEWPEIACCVNAGVHKLLLQDSVEGACQYCFGIIRSMRLPLKSNSVSKEKDNKVSSKQLLQKLFIKCTGMAFGCALCEVFYIWLNTTDNQDKHEKYWSIPKKYLDTKFKPGLLEDFLVNEWQDQLLLLLGVTEKQLDWLGNLLYGYEDEITEISKVDKTKSQCDYKSDDYGIDIQEVIDYMTLRRNHKLKKIQEIDEISNTKSAVNIACLFDHHVCKLPKKVDAETQVNIDNVKKQPWQCSYCHIRRVGSKKFKKCKRCLEENWPEPRCYCSTVCRIDHWFEHHHKEHSQYIKRMVSLH